MIIQNDIVFNQYGTFSEQNTIDPEKLLGRLNEELNRLDKDIENLDPVNVANDIQSLRNQIGSVTQDLHSLANNLAGQKAFYDNELKALNNAALWNIQRMGELADMFQKFLPKGTYNDFMKGIDEKRRTIQKKWQDDATGTTTNAT